ncbi:MAG: hypothetical protein ACXACC_00700 [Promethearchaeota archaeon]|jgi:hypothetical protein
MRFLNELSFHEFIGQNTLLYGEPNTQKTCLTAKFVEFLVESIKINPKQISILDFAPKLSYINNLKIGGRIQDFYKQSKKCNYIKFKGEIIPPRLKAKNKNELYKNLCHNHEITSYILQKFNVNPTSILIINDMSIYLHLGDEKYILNTIYRAKTFFGNSYFGYSIKKDFSKLLTIKERKRVEFLIKNIKNSIKTS